MIQTILFAIAAMVLPCGAAADGSSNARLQIEWSDEKFAAELKASGVFEDAVDFINATFRFERSLVLQLGAQDGPLYDPRQDVIQIPYEFYTKVVSLFAQLEPGDEAIEKEFAIDTLLHTLFHEYGHAVIDQFEIPVLGREEDAVDGLASVLLIEYYDNGAEMAINAAELFALESEDRGTLQEEDFWDEHSLDEQRYYSTMCHVVGSDAAEYSELAALAGFSEERAESCVFEYQQLVSDWDKLLTPVRR